jgi:hypothetical protein
MTLAVSAVTAVSLSACVAPGLNPTTKPKPPTTTKPAPKPTCPISSAPGAVTFPSGGGAPSTIDGPITSAPVVAAEAIYRVQPGAWVLTWETYPTPPPTPAPDPSFGAPDHQFVGADTTTAGTWLATIFPTDDRVETDGGLTKISPFDASTKVNPIAKGYKNGAYLVNWDLTPGCYRLTGTSAAPAQFEIFDDYSSMRLCSTPSGASGVCHDGSGAKIDMKFSGTRNFQLLPGDYILHYAGTLTKVA